MQKSDKLNEYAVSDGKTTPDCATVQDIECAERVEGVQKGLAARHVSFIALGGCIGSGLFMGTGMALVEGGPVGALLAYLTMSIVVFSVMTALGEISSVYARSGGFLYYATRFVDPALGMSTGWLYWYSLAVTIPNEISSFCMVVQYWPNPVPQVAWICIFMFIITCTNFVSVRWYGESEFWLTSIKITAVVGLLILGFVIDLGGAPQGGRLGFRYWITPGPFATPYGLTGSLAHFLGWWTTLIQAAFAFLGVEVVGLAAAESKNPAKTIPRATRTVFVRIIIFFIGSIFILGLTVPSNDPRLLNGGGDATASPFVIAMERAGIKVLPSIINAVIITTSFSAGNSFIYAASRSLYGLALDKQAPKIFARTLKNGLPVWAVAITVVFGFLSFMSLKSSAQAVFNWFFKLSAISGILAWIIIIFTYIRFYAGLKHHKVDRRTLPYHAPFQPWLSYICLSALCLLMLTNGYDVFLKGQWSFAKFMSSYLTLPLFAGIFSFWKMYKKTHFIRVEEMDFSDIMPVSQVASRTNTIVEADTIASSPVIGYLPKTQEEGEMNEAEDVKK